MPGPVLGAPERQRSSPHLEELTARCPCPPHPVTTFDMSQASGGPQGREGPGAQPRGRLGSGGKGGGLSGEQQGHFKEDPQGREQALGRRVGETVGWKPPLPTTQTPLLFSELDSWSLNSSVNIF